MINNCFIIDYIYIYISRPTRPRRFRVINYGSPCGLSQWIAGLAQSRVHQVGKQVHSQPGWGE